MARPAIRAIVLVSILSLCACSSGGGTPQPAVPEAPPASPASPLTSGPGEGNAELTITVKPSDSQPAINYTLICQDGVPTARSNHPFPAKACGALKNNPAVLTPPPRNKEVICTQQYGGPQTATVRGTVDGVPVDTWFARRDGCEISRWNAAGSILGPVGNL